MFLYLTDGFGRLVSLVGECLFFGDLLWWFAGDLVLFMCCSTTSTFQQ